jgi:hypothetical protein
VCAGKDSLQSGISHFVSSGGGGSGAQQLAAFFRRLAQTKESDLPCSMGKVQLSLSVTPALLGSSQAQQRQQQQQGRGLMGAAGAGHVAQLAAAGNGCIEVLREDWLVCNQLGAGAARIMVLDAWRQEKVKMIPWVGVAAQLATHVSVSSSGASSGRSLSCSSSSGGRAFCFLPLPADTSLPVHINGYFELSSNRCATATGCSYQPSFLQECLCTLSSSPLHVSAAQGGFPGMYRQHRAGLQALLLVIRAGMLSAWQRMRL